MSRYDYALVFDNNAPLSVDSISESSSFEFDKEEKKKAIKTFSRSHTALFVYLWVASLVISVVQYVTLYIYGEDRALEILENPYVLWGLQVLSMYVIAFPVFLLMMRKLPSSQREKSTISFKEFFSLFFMSEAIMYLGNMLSEYVLSLIYEHLNIEVGNATSDLIMETPMALIILVVVVIGPIIEEMIFRKVMIDKMSVYGDRLAVVVTSVAFGLFHGNLNQFFYATALGFVLGYVYTKTRRPIYNCLLHMMVNFMGTVPAIYMMKISEKIGDVTEDQLLNGDVPAEYYLEYAKISALSLIQILFLVIGVGCLITAIFSKNYRMSREKDIRIPVLQRPRVVIFNSGTILFFVFSVLQIVGTIFLEYVDEFAEYANYLEFLYRM